MRRGVALRGVAWRVYVYGGGGAKFLPAEGNATQCSDRVAV